MATSKLIVADQIVDERKNLMSREQRVYRIFSVQLFVTFQAILVRDEQTVIRHGLLWTEGIPHED